MFAFRAFVNSAAKRQVRMFGLSSIATFTVLGTAAFSTTDTGYQCPNDIGWNVSDNADFDYDGLNSNQSFDFNQRAKLLKQRINCKSKETMSSEAEMEKFGPVLHDNWEVHNIENKWHLRRDFYVDTMEEIKDICNLLFEVADKSHYHPDIKIKGHTMITVDLYSYRLDGLRVADFVVAARIDIEIEKLWKQYQEDAF